MPSGVSAAGGLKRNCLFYFVGLQRRGSTRGILSTSPHPFPISTAALMEEAGLLEHGAEALGAAFGAVGLKGTTHAGLSDARARRSWRLSCTMNPSAFLWPSRRRDGRSSCLWQMEAQFSSQCTECWPPGLMAFQEDLTNSNSIQIHQRISALVA